MDQEQGWGLCKFDFSMKAVRKLLVSSFLLVSFSLPAFADKTEDEEAARARAETQEFFKGDSTALGQIDQIGPQKLPYITFYSKARSALTWLTSRGNVKQRHWLDPVYLAVRGAANFWIIYQAAILKGFSPEAAVGVSIVGAGMSSGFMWYNARYMDWLEDHRYNEKLAAKGLLKPNLFTRFVESAGKEFSLQVLYAGVMHIAYISASVLAVAQVGGMDLSEMVSSFITHVEPGRVLNSSWNSLITEGVWYLFLAKMGTVLKAKYPGREQIAYHVEKVGVLLLAILVAPLLNAKLLGLNVPFVKMDPDTLSLYWGGIGGVIYLGLIADRNYVKGLARDFGSSCRAVLRFIGL